MYRQWFGEAASEAIVLLHEGLGSVSAWGRFPQLLAEATDWPVLAFDRAGYGRSEPKPGPWPARFMHDEAAVLHELLADEGVTNPLLVGHSDGASIALLYPSCAPESAPQPVGIVSLSAHVLVEPVCVESITAVRETYHDGLNRSLARHHDDADAVFEAWSEVWVSDRFRDWTIDDELADVDCPILAIQGADDKYGTALQLKRLADAVSGPCETIEIPGCDHWPHREATDLVLAYIAAFIGAEVRA